MAAKATRPTLSYSVDYVPVSGGASQSNSFATPSAALAFGATMAKANFKVTFKKWQNGAWGTDADNTSKLAEKLAVKGNPQAMSALSQLQELTGVAIKQANKASGIQSETARLWLDHVFLAMKAMHVVPTEVQARAQALTSGQAQPSREPAKA